MATPRSPRPQGRGPIAASRRAGRGCLVYGSPRPQGRGPIAADLTDDLGHPLLVSTASGPWPHCGGAKIGNQRPDLIRSPRPQGRGPIAAPRTRRTRARSGWSPRPQGRGPIAAIRSVRKLILPSSVSTASGPWPHCGMRMGAGCSTMALSPRPQGRGPIAAPRSATASRACPRSPRPQGRGPIAATCSSAGSGSPPDVSTASGPWPHCGTRTGTNGRASCVRSPRPQGRGPIAASRKP